MLREKKIRMKIKQLKAMLTPKPERKLFRIDSRKINIESESKA